MSLHLPRASARSSVPANSSPTAGAASASANVAEDQDMPMSSPAPFPSAPTPTSSWFARPQAFSTPSSAAASARQAARELRAERASTSAKSPFLPKKVQQGRPSLSPAGAANDAWAQLGVTELGALLERNMALLNSPATLAHLPGGDSKLLAQQARIRARLQELEDVKDMNEGLGRTHIDPDAGGLFDGVIKKEEVESEIEMENATTEEDPATSPLAKRRLAARPAQSPPASNSSPSTSAMSISLAESIALQQAHVARERAQTQLRAEREAALARTGGAGGRAGGTRGGLKGADAPRSGFKGKGKGKAAPDGEDRYGALDEFMAHVDSDDSDSHRRLDGEREDDEDSDDDLDVAALLAPVLARTGAAPPPHLSGKIKREPVLAHDAFDDTGGDHDEVDDEDQQLNPMRVAFESGWRRAEREEAEEEARLQLQRKGKGGGAGAGLLAL